MSYDTPEAVLRLARQFMESRILLTAAELDLFTPLAETAQTAEGLSGMLHCDLRALTVLLDALAAMGLLEKQDGAYRTPPAAAPFLSGGSPRSVIPMVLHAAHLWESWSGLTPAVRATGTQEALASDAGGRFDELSAFIGAMHVVGLPLAEKIVAAIGPEAAESLLDVGGASGTYTIAFLGAAPGMTATLFDRPEVIPMARSYVARELAKLGGNPVWRENVVTDNGNVILDVEGLVIREPKELEQRVNNIAGVVTVGLFALRGANVLILGSAKGAREVMPNS